MRIKALAATLALSGLAACSSQSDPRSTIETGVGFGDYQQYLHARTSGTASSAGSVPYSVPPQQARAETVLPPASMPPAPSFLASVPQRAMPVSTAAPVTAPVQTASTATAVGRPLVAPMTTRILPPQTAAATASPTSVSTRPAQGQAQAQVQAQPAQFAAAPPQPLQRQAPQRRGAGGASPVTNASVQTVQASAAFGTTPAFDQGPDAVRTRLSDEQDFQAVSARETIASDRERLARQRAQYEVIEVNSVPDASVSGGPNIVAFALSTSNPPGTEVYRRLNPLRFAQWQSACLQFRNQDAAQEAFLANGGPQRDPGNLDPDGDGYACWWDPTPLRQAMATTN